MVKRCQSLSKNFMLYSTTSSQERVTNSRSELWRTVIPVHSPRPLLTGRQTPVRIQNSEFAVNFLFMLSWWRDYSGIEQRSRRCDVTTAHCWESFARKQMFIILFSEKLYSVNLQVSAVILGAVIGCVMHTHSLMLLQSSVSQQRHFSRLRLPLASFTKLKSFLWSPLSHFRRNKMVDEQQVLISLRDKKWGSNSADFWAASTFFYDMCFSIKANNRIY